MKKYWYWDEPSLIVNLKRVLQEGKIVAGTSDTVIGLLAPLTYEGKETLDSLKKRNDKPYIVMVSDAHTGLQFSAALGEARLQPLLKACWPGPLTIIVTADEKVPSSLKSATGAIALRVPHHAGLQAILSCYPGLFSTSANISGGAVPQSVAKLHGEIVDNVAMIIDDREQRESKPSTIIDCTQPVAKIIREGAYSRAMLEPYIALEAP